MDYYGQDEEGILQSNKLDVNGESMRNLRQYPGVHVFPDMFDACNSPCYYSIRS